LLSKPKILIIDNPFIGLDALSRKLLSAMLEKLSALEGIQIVLVLSNPNDIPPFITDVLPVKGKTVLLPMKKSGFDGSEDFRRMLFEKENAGNIEELIPQSSDELRFNDALLFRNISVRYGTRTILKNINWRVRRGEKWALLGANGSGKSTLLSLVSGDNPQAYANDIVLFDRRRGSGESIWDIKSHIGYISPEMHLFYRKNVSCLDVVASGFFDTIGLYRKYNEVQGNTAMKWMKLLGIEGIKGSSFMHVSTGEQRLVLLARVFVKNPDLLVLDEPLHGLDIANRKRIKQIIDTFCTEGKSLIYVTHYEDEIPNTVTRRLCLSPQKGEQ
jgi:molybdate transport system ATP-binding protein